MNEATISSGISKGPAAAPARIASRAAFASESDAHRGDEFRMVLAKRSHRRGVILRRARGVRAFFVELPLELTRASRRGGEKRRRGRRRRRRRRVVVAPRASASPLSSVFSSSAARSAHDRRVSFAVGCCHGGFMSLRVRAVAFVRVLPLRQTGRRNHLLRDAFPLPFPLPFARPPDAVTARTRTRSPSRSSLHLSPHASTRRLFAPRVRVPSTPPAP